MKNKLLWVFFLVTAFITSSFSSEPIAESGGASGEAGVSRSHLHDCTPIGTVSAYAGVVAPDGWLICNGQIVSRREYRSLYEIIGRTYTSPSFSPPLHEDLFCLPDLRGRVVVGFDPTASLVSNSHVLGGVGGEELHTLTIPEIPVHDHTVSVSPKTQLGGPYPGDIVVPPTEPRAAVHSNTTSSGGGLPHNNMQPYLILNYIIKASAANVQEERLSVMERELMDLRYLLQRLDVDFKRHRHHVTAGAMKGLILDPEGTKW